MRELVLIVGIVLIGVAAVFYPIPQGNIPVIEKIIIAIGALATGGALGFTAGKRSTPAIKKEESS